MTDPSSESQHATTDRGGHGPLAKGGHEDDTHGGVGKYLLVFLALCALTSASFFTVSPWWPYHDTPAVGWVFMMAVSCTKAMLVISFFMHLIWEANWKYVLTIPASIMSVFLVLMLVPDIGERTLYYSSARWLHAAQPLPPGHEDSSHQHAGDRAGHEDAVPEEAGQGDAGQGPGDGSRR